MASNFGFLAKLEFLQVVVSRIIAGVNPAVIHNIEKYLALKKVHYLTAVEHLEGDYLEFGVFTGSSFTHSIRCTRKLESIYPEISKSRFLGFDSFQGFGDIESDDEHPFYTDENFGTSFVSVQKRVNKVSGEYFCKLVKGFFNDSLLPGPDHYDIRKIRIAFIDSDTYASSKDALSFISSAVQEGTYVVLDDFYSYRGSRKRGVARAFDEFLVESNVSVRKVFSYGMGGAVFVIDSVAPA